VLGPDDPWALSAAARFYRQRSESFKNLGKAREAKQYGQQARTLFEKLVAVRPDYAAELAGFLVHDAGDWTVLKPTVLASAGGATFTKLPDGSILAGGNNPDQEIYTIRTPAPKTPITAVRLEVLPDPGLPKGGTGRGPLGLFVLRNFRVSRAPGAEPDKLVPVPLARATASFQADKWVIGNALDANSQTGWAIYPRVQERQTAIFEAKMPLESPGAGTLLITMDFTNTRQESFAKGLAIGRFRLSVTTQKQPLRWQAILDQPAVSGWTKLAAAYYQRGEWSAALKAVEKATAAPAGGDGYAHFMRARVHGQLGRHDLARKWLDKATAWMDRNPSDDSLRQLAVEALTTMLRKTPNDVGLLVRRAHVRVRLGQRQQAGADYKKGSTLEPRNAKWPLRLAKSQSEAITFWSFDFGADGWQAANGCRFTNTANGLRVENTGDDPKMRIAVSGSAGWKELTLRARLKEAIVARLFWTTTTGGKETKIRSKWFALAASGKSWKDHRVYFWTGAPLVGLRLDPGTKGNQLEIDSMILKSVDGDRRKDDLLAQATKAVELKPEEALVRLARGDLHARFGRQKAAAADFAEALGLDPAVTLSGHRQFALGYEADGYPALAVVHLDRVIEAEKGKRGEASLVSWRGRLCAEAAQWKRAAADFSRAFEREPPRDANVWFEYAYLRLQVGDAEGYRKLCEKMFKQFGSGRAVDDIALLAHTCVLAPDALGDAARVQQLAEKRLALTPATSVHHPWSLHVLGLACYRAGEHRKAVEWLNKGLKEDPFWEGRVQNWLVLAMAEQRLGHAEEARKWLARAEQWINEKTRNQAGSGTRFAPTGWHWRDWAGIQRLRREAEALVKGKAAGPKK
jgi:tetratricopeptide (TPR) repeat protein